MSAVVIQELVAGSEDINKVKFYQGLMRYYEKHGRLLPPNNEDWFEAGKILYSLLNAVRTRTGKAPKLPKEEKRRIARDALIARAAKRAGCAVVTNNLKDFVTD
jgi:predicted nucleic acid-binding protein